MQVKRVITLPRPRDVVWSAIADPGRLGRWLGAAVETDIREGGEGTIRFASGEEREIAVVAVVSGERLTFRWGTRAAETQVELSLEDAPDGTRLTVVESPVILAFPLGEPLTQARAQPPGPVALAA